MMRRRGGTNKLRTPRKDKSYGGVKRKVPVASDVNTATPIVHVPGNVEDISEDNTVDDQIPGPSTLTRQTDSFSGEGDFVFKRPKTPPPKNVRKGPISTSGSVILESRRIRSKLKPGKTGFPIGASIHGLSRSEKLERRSKGKSRINPEGNHSAFQSEQQNIEPEFATEDEQSESGPRVPVERVISYPRQTVTKLRFPPPRNRTASERRSRKSEDLLDQQGVKESLEICQGFSKIKLEDWYPLYDFHHSKRKASDVNVCTSSETSTKEASKNGDDDDDDGEWEESLVYVDLEDIPDVTSLFSTPSTKRKNMNLNGEDTPNEDCEATLLSHVEMKIYNLDSKLPVLLLGGKYLAGHWEDSYGTSLFFKKPEGEDGSDGSPSTSGANKSKLKNIVPEPEIPYDPIFGRNHSTPEDGYELVAKSMKVLKARYFPVVSEEINATALVDDEDEFDHRDFQIPPINLVRKFIPGNLSYEEYVERDVERRRAIRGKWSKTKDTEPEAEENATDNIVKTEPLDQENEYASDTEDLDDILILDSEGNEPIPGTSRNIND